jgi:nucleoside-diphosphate-sugar epimerase
MFPFTGSDAQEVLGMFKGRARRVVAISSQDVYRAYGRLIGTEPGEPDPLPLSEDAPLRERLYPYRGEQPRPEDDPQRWMDDYDKIPAEQIFLGDPALPGTILRLPMVYGPRDDQHRFFATLKRMDDGRPANLLEEGIARWRWTRGYVENVAAAIALAVTNERAAGRIYNVGEPDTLTMAEWVRTIGELVGWNGQVIVLPKGDMPAHLVNKLNTQQQLITDTSRIRQELSYTELITRVEALRRTIAWERANPPEPLDAAQYDYAAEDAALRRRD